MLCQREEDADGSGRFVFDVVVLHEFLRFFPRDARRFVSIFRCLKKDFLELFCFLQNVFSFVFVKFLKSFRMRLLMIRVTLLYCCCSWWFFRGKESLVVGDVLLNLMRDCAIPHCFRE